MPRRANLHVGAFENGWHQRVALSQKGGINFWVGGIRWHQGGIRLSGLMPPTNISNQDLSNLVYRDFISLSYSLL